METNIIKQQLIDRSKKILEEKKQQSKSKLFYFEKSIGIIDSISLLPNKNGCLTPVLWETINGQHLIQIMRSLDKNEFFYYKDVRGKRTKMRLRK